MIKEDVGFGPTRGQNPPDGFQDRSLQPDLGNPPNYNILKYMDLVGLEPTTARL